MGLSSVTISSILWGNSSVSKWWYHSIPTSLSPLHAHDSSDTRSNKCPDQHTSRVDRALKGLLVRDVPSWVGVVLGVLQVNGCELINKSKMAESLFGRFGVVWRGWLLLQPLQQQINIVDFANLSLLLRKSEHTAQRYHVGDTIARVTLIVARAAVVLHSRPKAVDSGQTQRNSPLKGGQITFGDTV
ncbi:hypothetical protein K461DRAFT_272147 [Myriangium duriaei CBS 260.36]|uniref:Uncharacterized protein n=1 Tax=Myriangium duriaei CBS 260.36 TaxID=1168546 RepID=A0A9P4MHJ9_9PEZI|nr:hypothetical protein K461DRAFT_272147 [Myriangium duriaei CBS 260.36]